MQDTLNSLILREGDAAFVGFNSRLAPEQLPQGMLADSRNLRMEHQTLMPRKGTRRLYTGIGLELTNAAVVLPFTFGVGADIVLVSVTPECDGNPQMEVTLGGVLIIQTRVVDGHAVEVAGRWVDGSGLVVSFEPTGANTFSATATFADGQQVTVTRDKPINNLVAVGHPVLYDDYSDGARTAGLWRGSAQKVKAFGLTDGGSLKQIAFVDRGRTFGIRSGNLSSELTAADYLLLVFSNRIYLYDLDATVAVRVFDLSSDDPVPDTDQVSIVQAVNRAIVFRGFSGGEWLKPLVWDGQPGTTFEDAPDSIVPTNGNIPRASYGVWAGNRLIVPLEYTEQALVSLTWAAGVATATLSANLGLIAGQEITIAGATETLLNGTVLVIAVDEDAKTFTYATTQASTGTATGSPVVQLRTRDEFVISGVLEPFEYDMVGSHYRPYAGGSDFIVGFVPFQEDRVLVLMRRSIYVLNNASNDATASLDLVTTEVGCIGRRTAVLVGQDVYFLSDQGVYSLKILDELAVRGGRDPLSKPINNFMARVNQAAAEQARSVHFDNRIFFALPVDGATRNNAVAVYSILNAAWETIDVYPTGLFFDELVVAMKSGRNRLFGISREAGLVMLEEVEGMDESGGVGAALIETPVEGYAMSRRYQAGDPGIKFWRRVEAFVKHEASDRWSITPVAHTPDTPGVARVFAPAKAGQRIDRMPLRRRGNTMDVEFRSIAGRPELKRIVVEGTQTDSETRGF